MTRNFFIGGNWKMNGSVSLVKTLVDMLNGAPVPAGTGNFFFLFFSLLYIAPRFLLSLLLEQKKILFPPHTQAYRTSADKYICIEIVVSPPAIYVDRVRQTLKKEIGVAAQNSYVKASGAYTGEIRYNSLNLSFHITIRECAYR